jgi:hypothetical protein
MKGRDLATAFGKKASKVNFGLAKSKLDSGKDVPLRREWLFYSLRVRASRVRDHATQQ